ncbi:MAG: glycosyltransferase family 39 protein [Ruminococcus sp.]|nr:glycosyltransferase family 39 protein [Ruminococcus sp.]
MIKKYLSFISGIFFLYVIAVSATSLIPVISRILNSVTAGIIIVLVFLTVTYLIHSGAGKTENLLEKFIRGNKILSDRIFCILALILFIFQWNFAFIQDFTPKNDLSYICTGAENMVTGNFLYDNIPEIHSHYFSVYPNNHMILTVIYVLYRLEYLFTGSINNIFPVIFNIISLDISYILMYKISRIIHTPEKSVSCAVCGLILTPFVTYSAFFYTDSMTMPYITGALYFYIRYTEKYSTPDIIICGILTAVGYKFKGSAGLIIPAVITDIIINRRRNGLKSISLLITVFAVCCMIFSKISVGIINIDAFEMEKYKFPLIHWIMMSTHGRGGYCAEDFRYTLSFDGYNNKINADISRLYEKLSDMGVMGFLKHLSCKISYTWRDGTYMAGYYNKYGFLKNYAFYVLISVFHFRMLYKISGKFIAGKYDISGIIVIILALFLMVWETRCRYLVSFFPVLMLI